MRQTVQQPSIIRQEPDNQTEQPALTTPTGIKILSNPNPTGKPDVNITLSITLEISLRQTQTRLHQTNHIITSETCQA